MKEKLKTHKLIGIDDTNHEQLVSVGKLKQKGLAHKAYCSMEKLNISKEFHSQVEKMCIQDKHKWKDMCEKWEYAFNKVKNKAK